MKSLIGAAIISLVAGSALAQTTTTTTTISPAEEGEMHQYVITHHEPVVAPPPGFTVTRGAVVPPSVHLYSFEKEPRWEHYRYSVIGHDTVVVDPETRHIITTIR